MKKAPKTNAMRILDTHRIDYREILYDSDGFMDGVSIAEKLGQPVDKTFKTLVTAGKSKNHYVFMIPVAAALDLKSAAAAVGEKSVEMIPVKDITAVTGYIRGGCSPVGMKKEFPTYIDETAMLFDAIAVSGGMRGVQLIVNPDQLLGFVKGEYVDLTA